MGSLPNIGTNAYPEQFRETIGQRAVVIFHHDSSHRSYGTVLRDDQEEPFRTIIQLDDGRIVLSTECQWSPATDAEAKTHPRPESVPLYAGEG